ncbi:hypothetical protein [Bradyrhizobium pachyrhizi]|uniref:hypothetical protein n=1 Tax=Bradyrhizobium pachyrhizi TaxID=280333 RepID=UPI003D367497
METNKSGAVKTSLAGSCLAIPFLCCSLSGTAMARNEAAMPTDFSSVHRGGGAHAGGARPHPNAKPRSAGNVKRNTSVNHRAANVKRSNVNVRKDVNININRRTTVVARPVRGWAPRPYYGTIVGGIALGTVIAATTVGVAPAPPATNMCWFWSDSGMSQGYWDYCVAP